MSELTKDDNTHLTIELDVLIDEVQTCVKKCRLYSGITGIGKLERKFRAEERFLQRVRRDEHVSYRWVYTCVSSFTQVNVTSTPTI